MARGVRIMDFVAFTRLDQFLINIICRGCIIIKRLDMWLVNDKPTRKDFLFLRTSNFQWVHEVNMLYWYFRIIL